MPKFKFLAQDFVVSTHFQAVNVKSLEIHVFLARFLMEFDDFQVVTVALAWIGQDGVRYEDPFVLVKAAFRCDGSAACS